MAEYYPKSRPVWGAWIEMNNMLCNDEYAQSRAPYGARGLKFANSPGFRLYQGVAPRMGRVD